MRFLNEVTAASGRCHLGRVVAFGEKGAHDWSDGRSMEHGDRYQRGGREWAAKVKAPSMVGMESRTSGELFVESLVESAGQMRVGPPKGG